MVTSNIKIEDFMLHKGDTGSADVQIVRLTKKILQLTKHLEIHKKDHSTKRGLLKMVARRRSLLSYIKTCDVTRYKKIISSLGIRG